jgi:hypothetical protein
MQQLKDSKISDDEWVNWLLADNCWWLWTSDTLRETMRLLVLKGGNLAPIIQKRLETAILAGPPRKMYREDLEPQNWQEIQEHLIWLRLAKLQSSGCVLGNDAARRLNELSTANPNWQIATDERDEFLSWTSGTGDPDFEERHPISRVPRQLDELVNWLKQEPTPRNDPFNRDDWRDVCQTKFATAFGALCQLSQENIWPSSYWREALQVWSEEKRVRHCWRYVAPLVSQMPDKVIADLKHTITWWLQSTSQKGFNCHEDLFFSLCDRYLDLEYQNQVRENRDSVSDAINHPVGHVTQALINVWFHRQPSDNDGLPDDIKPRLSRLCETEMALYRHGRVVLASRLISLFRIDREWTEQYVLPFFNWQRSESEARVMWTGFLWSPRIYWPLMAAFKNDFLESVNHYQDLSHSGQQYLSLLTFAALDPASTFTTKEYRSAIASLPQAGLEVVAASLVRALESAGEQREQYWLNRVRPFWQEIWPKDNQKMSPSIAQNLAHLSIAARNEFPSALSIVTDWLQPFDSHYIFYLIGESDLCAKFPQDVLGLLDRIVSEAFWLGSELGQCLDKIASAWPESKSDPCYRKLQEFRRS